MGTPKITNNPQDRIGLVAGNGIFPLVFAQEARRRGDLVVAAALKEEADPRLAQWVDGLEWISIGQLGRAIEFFKAHGVQRAVMAGQVKHTQLFRNIVPDWRAAKVLAKSLDRKADSILSAVTQEFAQDGIEFLSSATYLEHLLAPAGLFSGRPLNAREDADVRFGVPLARQLASADIGQTLVVKELSVVSAEAMEGTDAAIRRAGEVAGPGCVVVKVARPKQNVRFDLPVVGLKTMESMQTARASVLAVESGKTLLLEKEDLIQKADVLGISLFGIQITGGA